MAWVFWKDAIRCKDDVARRQLNNLGKEVGIHSQQVSKIRRIARDYVIPGLSQSIVRQVNNFVPCLCNADYIGHTNRHLPQHMNTDSLPLVNTFKVTIALKL